MAKRRQGVPRRARVGPPAGSTRRPPARRAPAAPPPCPIVGVGASAGGLEAFRELLAHLPPGGGLALVFVQHLAPTHESHLVPALALATTLPVADVTDGLIVEPDHVYVIPPNTTMELRRGRLRLAPRAEEARPHLPIDRFFETLAAERGAAAIGVVLSGTASDATAGLQAIRRRGGLAIAQDPTTARYDGMPRSAIAAGAVDLVLAPAQIAERLAALARRPAPPARVGRARDGGPAPPDELEPIYTLVRDAIGVDFAEYKQTTVRRRIARRVAARKAGSLDAYARLLREEPAEIAALYEEIFVHVTGFFRDPAAFEALARRVFPELLRSKPRGEAVRIWAAGCSTGEEAYSLAIALVEQLGPAAGERPIQIFGSDMSEQAIQRARAATYGPEIADSVGKARLERFFVRADRGYRVAKAIRDLCVFVKHDVTADPPFSRLDLVSCRNVLIYFGAALQRRVVPLLHYALNQPGYLLLGRTETISGFGALFGILDKEHRIYARKAAPARLGITFAPTAHAPGLPEAGRRTPVEPPRAGLDVQREVDHVLLGRFAPPGVLVDDGLEILQFRGRTGPYLEQPPGEATLQLGRLAREGLLAELRRLIQRARAAGMPARSERVAFRQDGRRAEVALEVIPLWGAPPARPRFYLVLFEPPGAPAATGARAAPAAPPADGPRRGAAARELGQLRQELASTKDYLQAAIEQHASTNDELTATNEELLSSNEELQSTNEELETAKEELQSTNEELTTVNDELQSRNVELNQANNDLVNLLASVDIAIVIVDATGHIRRFTPKAREVMNLIPGDVGRPISDINPTLELPDLARWIAEVIEAVAPRELEVTDRQGRWYRLQLRPYKTSDHKIDGAVVSLIDIDALRRSLATARESRDFTAGIVETIGIPLAILEADLRVAAINPAFTDQFDLAPAAVEQRALGDLGASPWRAPALAAALEQASARRTSFQGLELEVDDPRRGRRWLLASGRPLPGRGEGPARLLLSLQDVTDRRRLEQERLRAEARRGQEFLDEASALLLPESLDYRATLERLAHLAVPRLGDWCLVDLLDDDGVIRQAAAAHRDPDKEQRARELGRRLVPEHAPARGVGSVIQTGQSEVYPEVASEEWLTAALGLDHPTVLRELGARSYLCVPLRGRGGVIGALSFARAASARRFTEADVALAEELGRRAGLAVENARLYRAAQEAIEAREEFLAIASHELKTPLSALVLQLQMAERMTSAADPAGAAPKVRGKLDRALRQTARLTALVENLLDISRITSGRLSLLLEQVDLAQVVRDAALRSREAAEQLGSRLDVQAPDPVIGRWDRLRLEQVVHNLLSNAIKYGDGRPVELAVDADPARARLTVRDHGIGIPREQQARIFERFARAVRSQDFAGMGLGLYITRQVVEAHGGAIRVESRPGAGSTFTVELPRRDPGEERPRAAIGDAPATPEGGS